MSRSRGVISFCVFIILRIVYCGSTVGLRLKTEPDQLLIDWAPGTLNPDRWQLVYRVIGTGYHSTITLNGSVTSTSIQTSDYPGMMYAVSLFGVTNGTKSYFSVRYGRSGCIREYNTTIGHSYKVTSKGYPTYKQRGAICNWIFYGSDVTWYRIDVIDVDLNVNESNCENYVETSEWKLCGNNTTNETYYVKNRNLHLKYVTTKTDRQRGFNMNITAIHKTDAPYNVSAVINGDVINVTWNKPVHHPTNFSYTLRIYNQQQQTNTDITVPSNKTFYLFNYRGLAGHTFVVSVMATSDGIDGEFSNSVELQTSCDRWIHIKPTDSVELTSTKYPFGYLQGISCRYHIYTDGDFIIRIMTSEIDISGGSRCENTYLRIGELGQFCAISPPEREIVIQNSTVDVFFRSNGTPHGKGFNITVSSVSKPPSEPTLLTSKILPNDIRISWKPPTLNQPYVDGYKIEYFILPDTAGGAIHAKHDVTNVTIPTTEHPGRLYTIRASASTAGGQGPFSRPLFARSACGSKHHLTRKESSTISTEAFLRNGNYQFGTICQWNIMTDPLLWLRIDVETLDIELAPNCSKDFLRVNDGMILCGQINSKTLLVERNSIDMMFSSDFNVTGKGFRMTVTAIGPKPGVPSQISIIPMEYGIFVTWNQPEFLHQFVTGYLVHYRIRNHMRNFTVRADRADNSCILDMTSFPGKLVEVWLQAAGDMINSNSSSTVVARNECGSMYNISERAEPLYISSPYQTTAITGDIYCKWTIIGDLNTQYRIHFIRYSVNNGDNCDNSLTINSNISVCNGSVTGSGLDLPLTSQFTIELKVVEGGYLNFLLSLQAVSRISDRSTKTERITSTNAATYSSTSLAVLISSLISSFVASTSWDTWQRSDKLGNQEVVVEKSSSPDIDSQSIMPSTVTRTAKLDSIIANQNQKQTGNQNTHAYFSSCNESRIQPFVELNSDNTDIVTESTDTAHIDDGLHITSHGVTDDFASRESELLPSFRAVPTDATENHIATSLNEIYTDTIMEMIQTNGVILDTSEIISPNACTTDISSQIYQDNARTISVTYPLRDKIDANTVSMHTDKRFSQNVDGRLKCRTHSFIEAVVTTFETPIDKMRTSRFEPQYPEVTLNTTTSNQHVTNLNEQGNFSTRGYLFDHSLFSSVDELREVARLSYDVDVYASAQSSSVTLMTATHSVGDKRRETIHHISYNAGFSNEASAHVILSVILLVILCF